MPDLPPRIIPVSRCNPQIIDTLNGVSDGQWSVLAFPHELSEGNALDAFVKALEELPDDVEGVRAQVNLRSPT
jgi:hypothetical protein